MSSADSNNNNNSVESTNNSSSSSSDNKNVKLSEIERYINDLQTLNAGGQEETKLLAKIPVATKISICMGFIPATASTFQNHNCRHPTVIFRLASNLLVHHKSQMSAAELYSIYEVGAQAALDLGHDNLAADWIVILKQRFGHCSRVARLVGLLEESQVYAGTGTTSTAKALEYYNNAKNEFPNEVWPIKRLAAMYKSRGRIADAIGILETKGCYIDKLDDKSYPFRQLHPLDDGTLKELVNLHWMNDSVEKSIFFAEELLLLDPHNFLFLSRIGELCYAAGQFDRAISSYSQSIRLNPHSSNCRAVLGLWQSCLEWRHHNKNSASNNAVEDNNKKNSSSSSQQMEYLSGNSVTAKNPSANSTNAPPQMSLALCNNLINISEARLREYYQNSPLCSVLELTLRRYNGNETQ